MEDKVMVCVGELLIRIRSALEGYGVENARFEAEQVLVKAGIPKQSVLWEPHEDVLPDIEKRAAELLERRLSGYPLQYLIGDWDFYGCTFKVGEGVLIPRQDTECLAELAEGFLKNRSANRRRVLDLCAGSGCIGIVLAKLCGAGVVCVEKSEEAFGYLVENIRLNGAEKLVNAVCADIFDEAAELAGEYDVIVSNPPYLTAEDMDSLQSEVAFEPEAALYGGEDGLEFYRRIPKMYLPRLVEGGLFAVEVGYRQAGEVSAIFRKYGLKPSVQKDLCGNDRVVYGVK